MKQKELEKATLSRRFNTFLMVLDNKNRFWKYIEHLRGTINIINLIDVHKTLHSILEIFAGFQGKYAKLAHLLSYETNLNKCQRAEFIQTTSN